jgi:uncharacterized SAM-binding protein YcdF (DUF218 family)
MPYGKAMTDQGPPIPPPELPSRAPLADRGLPPLARAMLAGVTVLASLATVALLAGFLAFIDRLSHLESEFGRQVDGIVVLTGGADRITEALSVLAEGRGKRLLISGVGDKTPVADLIRHSGHARLFECCVDIDRKAQNTVGNALETATWARRHQYRAVMVVTSNYHMPRALLEFRRHLKGVDFIPHPVIAESIRADQWWTDPGLARLMFGEYLKFVVAEARSRLVPDNPARQ